MKIKIFKYKDVKTPIRAHHNDSGADIFAVRPVMLEAGKVTAIPAGFGMELPNGYDAVVHCKSGLSRAGIWASNSPIDAGYRGQVHVILLNTTDKDYLVRAGEKIGQLVVRPVVYAEFVENINEEERGAGAFGSTDK